MSIFDVFKPKWSAKDMVEDDRRKLFWHLKRASSYTGWKNLSDAFDRFAVVFERQVREQPMVVEDGLDPAQWGTNWEGFYSKVLKAQVLFEQGLTRLRNGDRTVWRYSDLGILGDAYNIYGYWWSVLVNHGPHGDIYFEGKYVDEMVAVLHEVQACAFATAGILQSPWAEPPARLCWTPSFIERLERELSFPSPLPEVPLPSEHVVVRTGEPAPRFGVYEPLVEDGCMNYLLQGAPAPKALNQGGIIRPAAWRLIWEDKRYLDGVVPEEEKFYFRPTEVIRKPVESTAVELDPVISSQSNRKVPKAGIWVVAHRLDVRQTFDLDEIFPSFDGQEVVWLWVSKQ
jgi:hypothetical protein